MTAAAEIVATPGGPMGSATLVASEVLPPALVEPSLLGLQRWQWIAAPLLLLVLALVAALLARLTLGSLRRLAARTQTNVDDRVVSMLAGPTRLLWASLLARVGVPLLGLPASVGEPVLRSAHLLLALALFWGLLRSASAWGSHFGATAFARTHPGSKALVGLLVSVARLALMALAMLSTLSFLGYSVTSVLAGLGLGGLALALGAQKTLENVFGAFALAVDQPFREGDFIRVEELSGTVETIGLRSTRIRTVDRTLVSIPNGKLADLRLENFSMRDRVRFSTTVSLGYTTTTAQLAAVVRGLRDALDAQPTLSQESVTVRLQGFGVSSLDIEVMCWFEVTDFDAFKVIREQVLVSFLSVVRGAGARFALPTQVVHLSSVGEPSPQRAAPAT